MFRSLLLARAFPVALLLSACSQQLGAYGNDASERVQCPTSQALCGDECVTLSRDDLNCGACGNRCEGPSACGHGHCVPYLSTGGDGPFAPARDVVLHAGVYNFTTVEVPAGVRVTTDGDGVIELRATGDVTIDGVIDLSGGAGADGIIDPNDRFQHGGGGGGSTGIPTPATPTTLATCSMAGMGGVSGSGSDGVLGLAPDPEPGTCVAWGGAFGGGTGGIAASGGGGGGGRAGGGGGPGDPPTYAVGGHGSMVEGAGGTPGDATYVAIGGGASTLVFHGGGGGLAPGDYAGNPGDPIDGRTCTSIMGVAGHGGGGSIGPAAAADLAVAQTFYPGSGGGGGGGAGGSEGQPGRGGGGGGGGGGGALRITTPGALVVTGSLLANGGAGGSSLVYLGHGGGGSGGVIYLAAVTMRVTGAVLATGGLGARGGMCNTAGGDGGLGRVRVWVPTGADCELSGEWMPPLANGCATSTTPGAVYIGS